MEKPNKIIQLIKSEYLDDCVIWVGEFVMMPGAQMFTGAHAFVYEGDLSNTINFWLIEKEKATSDV